ncbi:hypothetical protein SNEBB_010608 [Seison nebaliae]|nr:hypothetical protein SNEBB_010608 [Seison nebaliae]
MASRNRVEKQISQDLFTLFYGTFVQEIVKDYEDLDEVNKQLDGIGYNIGIRLIDDYLARKQITDTCKNVQETASHISDGFRLFLGMVAQTKPIFKDPNLFHLSFNTNPLSEYAELPSTGELNNLNYSQVVCGCIRGALEMVHLMVEVKMVQDMMKGDKCNEFSIKVIGKIPDPVINDEDDDDSDEGNDYN